MCPTQSDICAWRSCKVETSESESDKIGEIPVTYTFMAYIVNAFIIVARIGMACMAMAYTISTYTVMSYTVVAYR